MKKIDKESIIKSILEKTNIPKEEIDKVDIDKLLKDISKVFNILSDACKCFANAFNKISNNILDNYVETVKEDKPEEELV